MYYFRKHVSIADKQQLSIKCYDFYRDSNIMAVKPSYQILKVLEFRISELLNEWPDHPVLQNVSFYIVYM